jgi:hypothetical protein
MGNRFGTPRQNTVTGRTRLFGTGPETNAHYGHPAIRSRSENDSARRTFSGAAGAESI